MLELKRPLSGLKKNIYGFQDMSANADNTFKVTDLTDKFLLGKNSFKLHLKEDVLVYRSQVYIDIIDSFGNPIYYNIISDNLPNKERIVAVYIYDTTPIGDCEIIIAGRLLTNPKTGLQIPYSNEPSSPDYHGIPNVAWRKVVQINPQEVESPVFFSIPPTVTYSEVRKPQYELSTNSRVVTLYATASSTATMYSNRGQMTTLGSIDANEAGHLVSLNTSSATFVPITSVNDEDEIASLYLSNFDITSSMEGGRIFFNNIPYVYPRNAVVTESKVLNYSGSIVKVIDKNTCYVNPPFYQTLDYTDNNGIQKKLVLDGFRELNNFTASYYSAPNFTTNSSSYNSYIKLEIANAEPDIGSIKTVKIKAKSINKPGQLIDLGTYDVEKKNILIANSSSYTMTNKGIMPLSLGDFRKLGTPTTYWTGSVSNGDDIIFVNNDSISDGVFFSGDDYASTTYEFVELKLRSNYLPVVKKDTEYELSFDMKFFELPNVVIPKQLDVYISGSEIEKTTDIQNTTLPPKNNSRFGTYIGGVNTYNTNSYRPKLYFTAKKTGRISPVFIQRYVGVTYSNIELTVRNEPGYSSKFIDLEVPLPNEFSNRSEIGIEIDYYNSKNERANYGTNLYGVVFEGNTPTSTGSSTTVPPGTVSGSDQLTSSYDTRYERKGTNIVSSSNQIASDISGSFTSLSSSLAGRLGVYDAKTLFSSSIQVIYSQISGIPSGSLTGSGVNNQVGIFSGSSGYLSGSNNFTFNGNTLNLSGSQTITGSLSIQARGNGTGVAFEVSNSGIFTRILDNGTIQQTSGSTNIIKITNAGAGLNGTIAIGKQSSATGIGTMALGTYADVQGSYSQAIGAEATVGNFAGSTAIGRYALVGANAAYGIGTYLSNAFSDSFLIGNGQDANGYNLLLNKYSNSIGFGAFARQPQFIIRGLTATIISWVTGSGNTITATSHGLIAGEPVILERSTGARDYGTVVSVTDANNFVFSATPGTATGTGWKTYGTSNIIEITNGTDGSASIAINKQGYLSLGKTTANYRLDVSGSGNFSNDLIISGSLIANRVTGSFSGSFQGQYSSSQQVNYDQITNKPSVSGSGIYRLLISSGSESSSYAHQNLKYDTSQSKFMVTGSTNLNGNLFQTGSTSTRMSFTWEGSKTVGTSPGIEWTNMENQTNTWLSSGGTANFYSTYVGDFTEITQGRLFTYLGTIAGGVTCSLEVQYSVNGGANWNSMVTLVIGSTPGIKDSGWLRLPTASMADCYIRLVGWGGDGLRDPMFSPPIAVFR